MQSANSAVVRRLYRLAVVCIEPAVRLLIAGSAVDEVAPRRTTSRKYATSSFECSEAFTVIGGTETISD